MKFPQGFISASVASGLKSGEILDLTIIQNVGPRSIAAGVFTTNKVQAAPVQWSKQVVQGGAIRAVVMNSGGANACTGAQGFADTHLTAETVADVFGLSSSEIAVCSTGLIGEYLPMPKIIDGISKIFPLLNSDNLEDSARAIMTTDSHPKIASESKYGVEITGIAKGAGMLAPALATMLSVITTDADLGSLDVQSIFTQVVDRTFNRLDSDGCTSTNDTILFLASGSSGVSLSASQLEELLVTICNSLCYQLIGDAEGRTKIVSIEVVHALSEIDAVKVARECARNNLLKCALFGGDPNWGRILAAVGTADAKFNPLDIDVQLNGVWVCRESAPGESKTGVDLSGENIHILIDLKSGSHSALVLTNDLSHEYVHENSAYAS